MQPSVMTSNGISVLQAVDCMQRSLGSRAASLRKLADCNPVKIRTSLSAIRSREGMRGRFDPNRGCALGMCPTAGKSLPLYVSICHKCFVCRFASLVSFTRNIHSFYRVPSKRCVSGYCRIYGRQARVCMVCIQFEAVRTVPLLRSNFAWYSSLGQAAWRTARADRKSSWFQVLTTLLH